MTEMIIMIAVTIVLVIVDVHLAMHFMAMILVSVCYRPRTIRQPFETDEYVANKYRNQDKSGHMLR